MGLHFENVNVEDGCNWDNFELYASVDPPTLRLSLIIIISLSLSPAFSLCRSYGMGKRGRDPSPDCATAKYELRYDDIKDAA